MMFAALLVTNIALGSGNLRVDILPLNAERAVVAISNSEESRFEISLKNASGEVVYYQETEGSLADYRKVYDFSNMEPGTYTLEVSIDGATSKRQFDIDGHNINVGKLKSVVEPYFAFNEDVLRISYLNFPGDKMELLIYDGDELLIYNKALENTFSVNEGLNLSKLKNGNYQVVLASGEETFGYAVEVK